MATVAKPQQVDDSESSIPRSSVGAVYDRSSLAGDYMVMIADQTADDFENHAPENQFCEYFDGIVYMPSPVTDRHQEQAGFLYFLIHGFCCQRGVGRALTGPAVLRLTPQWKPEPDIFVRPPTDAPAPQLPALLVVEIHSPSTREHDLNRKLSAYRENGIPNIWMVDDRDRILRSDTRQRGQDSYVHRELTSGCLDAPDLPGFWIDVSWLWNDPLPNAALCLDQVLAGPPA